MSGTEKILNLRNLTQDPKTQDPKPKTRRMSTLFYGLNIVKNALKTQTAILNITAHNIANAETPGYSRQNVIVAAIADDSYRGLRSSPTISIGSGVEAVEVVRSRFALYDAIFRKENQDLNDFIKTEELLHQVELLFDEPSERGMSRVINDFFNGWQEVANDPHNMAARQSLKSFGEELASRLNRTYKRLQILREDIDNEIKTIPKHINEITAEIADLNISVRVSESQEASANDLRDKRDYLVDTLSEYVDVKAIEQNNGAYTIIIGSQVAVENDVYTNLSTVSQIVGEEGTIRTAILSDEGIEYIPEHGKMGALIKFRDYHLKNIMEKLDKLTESFVNSVNYDHSYGYGLNGTTNVNFFSPNKTKAFNIEVSSEIDDVRKIAASGDGSVGDNSNALRVNDIKDQDVVDQEFTLNEYYNSMIAGIGIMAREAQSGRVSEELLVTQINNAREGIKGVSIDDELIQMISTQRIYQSAAHMVRVLDSRLEEVLGLK